MKANDGVARKVANAVSASLEDATSYDGTDEDEAWRLTLNVLAALYGAEEIERQLDPRYYAHRDANPNGRVLGGLIWCRGDVQHAGGDVRRLDWSRAETFVRHEGQWMLAQPYVRRDGEWVATQPMVRGWTWPSRADSPAEGRGRDAMYAEGVARRPWLEPMRRAASYLVDERRN